MRTVFLALAWLVMFGLVVLGVSALSEHSEPLTAIAIVVLLGGFLAWAGEH